MQLTPATLIMGSFVTFGMGTIDEDAGTPLLQSPGVFQVEPTAPVQVVCACKIDPLIKTKTTNIEKNRLWRKERAQCI